MTDEQQVKDFSHPIVQHDKLGFVKNYYCPSCNGELKLSHSDDVGTKFFKCEKCGHLTSLPKASVPDLVTASTPPSQNVTLVPPVTMLEDDGGKPSQADKLVLLASRQCIEFFTDQTKTAYAQMPVDGARVHMPLRSRPFRAWLARLLWLSERKAPGPQGICGAVNVLEAQALFQGKRYTLHNRVAPADDGIWLDMSDELWRAIKVTPQGWSIVEDPPILFKRYSHQRPMVEPKRGGNPWRLLDFLNIDPLDAGTRLLFLCDCISFLIPLIPHPILVLHGIQGSGKSCNFRLLRRLLDPSVIELLTLPRDERERVQQLDHHWLAFYDNVTSISWWMSDTLCRAATGGGFTKRELYSDDSDVIYDFKRCVGLNGINIAAQRGDLLDRSLLVGLQNIPREKRRTEEQLLREFEAIKAEILGGFLDTLVKAIQIYPSVNLKGLFRMADFTRWGCAIATALGKTEKEFSDAYEANVRNQTEEAAHASPVATVLLDFMEKKGSNWKGTPTELFTALLNHARQSDISTRQKAWPKAPHVLIRQLNDLAPSLKSLGWEVSSQRTGATRKVQIQSVTSDTTVSRKGENSKCSDANDANSSTSSRLATHATSAEEADFLWRRIRPAERCELCGVFSVEYEISHVNDVQILRRCNSCFNEMHKQSVSAVWREAKLE